MQKELMLEASRKQIEHILQMNILQHQQQQQQGALANRNNFAIQPDSMIAKFECLQQQQSSAASSNDESGNLLLVPSPILNTVAATEKNESSRGKISSKNETKGHDSTINCNTSSSSMTLERLQMQYQQIMTQMQLNVTPPQQPMTSAQVTQAAMSSVSTQQVRYILMHFYFVCISWELS